MLMGLLGIKRGMSRIFMENGDVVPVTLLEISSNYVTQIKTIEKNGYNAVQLTIDKLEKKKLLKSQLGQIKMLNIGNCFFFREFYFSENSYVLGDEIPLSIFKTGDIVDITGMSKGKGFAGTIKRHNFSRQRASHGNSLSHRVPGSIGQCQTPGRVFKGKKMAGHMGNERVTIQNLEIIKINFDKKYLLVKGAVPGCVGSVVLIKKSYKVNKINKMKFFKGV